MHQNSGILNTADSNLIYWLMEQEPGDNLLETRIYELFPVCKLNYRIPLNFKVQIRTSEIDSDPLNLRLTYA